MKKFIPTIAVVCFIAISLVTLVGDVKDADKVERDWLNNEISKINKPNLKPSDPEVVAILEEGRLIFDENLSKNVNSSIPYIILYFVLLVSILYLLKKSKHE